MSCEESSWDLIVVGGGPAGSTIATLVAMQGRRVLLLEKETTPSYKIGESLLPATIHGICPLLGVEQAVKDAGFVRKLGGTFRWGKSQEPWTFGFSASPRMEGPKSFAYQVERIKFDAILLDNARDKGVEVRRGFRATEPMYDGDRVAGIRFAGDDDAVHSGRARWVADASGHGSPLARFAGNRVYSQYFQNVALFGYYENAGRLPPPNQGNIFCAAFEQGWFWYIPLSPVLTSVGAVVGKEYSSRIAGAPERAMDEFIQGCRPIADLLSNAARVTEGVYGKLRVRKDYSYCHSHFWRPGLVLLGDAACFIDPVFSSGVHLATYSALLAARSVNTCLAGALDEQSCFGEFEARYRREYRHFHDFLVAFYDMDSDLDSYYWNARKAIHSTEPGNAPFIDLVGGVSSADATFCPDGGLGNVLFPQAGTNGARAVDTAAKRGEFYNQLLGEIAQIQMQASLKELRPPEMPLFPDGLIPSPDGLHWMRAGACAAS